MDYTIDELPKSERPREKLEENGVKSLTDVELLSIILRTGIPGKNVKELSAEILNELGLQDLVNRSLEDLKGFDGVSRVKAGQLKAVAELGRRMKREKGGKIENLSDVKARVGDMKLLDKEVLRTFYLSSGNELLDEQEFRGGVSTVGFSPRNVFEEALRSNAAAVILAHNHPSGKAEPTPEDIAATRELIDAGETLGVEMLDHVIVGETVQSLRASTELNF